MSYARGEHPNSRANLTSFKPGQSGNPGGRRYGAWTPADYLRHLQGDDFTQARLETISNDEAEPCGKRAAARMQLAALVSEEANLAEKVEARRVFESINDRLEGTPVQSVRTIDMSAPDAGQVLSEIRANLVGADLVRFEELAAPARLTLTPSEPDIVVSDVAEVPPDVGLKQQPKLPSSSRYDGSSASKYHGSSATKWLTHLTGTG